jgi:hypothetical protein
MAKKINIRLDFSEDNFLIGISCHKRDYWLGYQLNKALDIDFERITDLTVFSEKNNNSLKYPIFYFDKSDSMISYYLISNYNTEGKLFGDFKTLDYFLLINGYISGDLLSETLNSVKKIKNVLAAYEIKISGNKNIGNFLSDLELHMIEFLRNAKNK